MEILLFDIIGFFNKTINFRTKNKKLKEIPTLDYSKITILKWYELENVRLKFGQYMQTKLYMFNDNDLEKAGKILKDISILYELRRPSGMIIGYSA